MLGARSLSRLDSAGWVAGAPSGLRRNDSCGPEDFSDAQRDVTHFLERARVVSHRMVYERGPVTMIAGRFGPVVMPGWPAG